eukprot:TRINITY_DN11818_c0_g1_i1.p1 TRINITY_DN11818_c0_g1~~TRINITY_DN11818_c0_g1_i1.p1  ORF type:complete len:408 (+),score=99.19 TRINITY_DN11818_c0_g1_i1:60-1283(+)
MAACAPASAKVLALFTRACDLGDRGHDADEERRRQKGYVRFTRQRVGDGVSVPVSAFGLEDSAEWHVSDKAWSKVGIDGRLDRAVLVQSQANISQLLDQSWKAATPVSESMVAGAFGENIFVDEMQAKDLCVGDTVVVERQGQPTGLKLVVTAPRRPCASVDARHGQRFGDDGVRAHCARTGRAGWFARVLSFGTLQEGDTFRVETRKHPAWTLDRISKLVYGKSARTAKYDTKLADWCGSDAELDEMVELKDLTVYEWRGVCDDLKRQRMYPELAVGATVRLAGQCSYAYTCIHPGEEGRLVKIEEPTSSSRYITALASDFQRPLRVVGPRGDVQWYAAHEVVVTAPPPSTVAAAGPRTAPDAGQAKQPAATGAITTAVTGVGVAAGWWWWSKLTAEEEPPVKARL